MSSLHVLFRETLNVFLNDLDIVPAALVEHAATIMAEAMTRFREVLLVMMYR